MNISTRRAPSAAPLLSSEALGWRGVKIERRVRAEPCVVAYPAGLPDHALYLWQRTSGCVGEVGDLVPLRLEPGGMLLVPADTPARFVIRGPAVFTRVELDPGLTGDGLTASDADVPGARALAEGLLASALAGDPVDAEDVEGLAARLARLLARGGDRGAGGRLGPAELARLAGFFDAHLERSVRVDELAGALGMERHRLSALLQATTGETPHRWMAARRLERACAMLLVPGGTSVAEVAAACGFADHAHLARAFRRRLGTTPSRWRFQRRGDSAAWNGKP